VSSLFTGLLLIITYTDNLELRTASAVGDQPTLLYDSKARGGHTGPPLIITYKPNSEPILRFHGGRLAHFLV